MKKTRNKDKKRQAIIKGAIKIFNSVGGYEEASMDSVAEAANVSKRTVYNHFGSKDNLFDAVVSSLLEQRDELKQIEFSSDKPIKVQLIAFANAELFLVNDSERLGLSRVLTSVFIKDMMHAYNIAKNYEPPHQRFIEWLKAVDEQGALRIENPEMTAKIFYGMVEGALTWPVVFSRTMMPKEQTEMILDEIIELFLNQYERK